MPSAFPRGLGPPHPVGAARWQVFGLVGINSLLLAVASQTFTGPVLCDGVRSHSPLRGSPGLTPGSLLPLLSRTGEPAA